jgi:hypothetical protein
MHEQRKESQAEPLGFEYARAMGEGMEQAVRHPDPTDAGAMDSIFGVEDGQKISGRFFDQLMAHLRDMGYTLSAPCQVLLTLMTIELQQELPPDHPVEAKIFPDNAEMATLSDDPNVVGIIIPTRFVEIFERVTGHRVVRSSTKDLFVDIDPSSVRLPIKLEDGKRD